MNLRNFTTLQLALGVSVAVHAVLLTVRLVDPQAFDRVFEDTALEVILVNARTNERADKAQAIAQAQMAGGGDAAQGRATSPLPSSLLEERGDAPDSTAQQQLQRMEMQQTLMLAQIKQELASFKPPELKQFNPTQTQEQEAKRRLLIKQLAAIERRISHENARPKKRYISPATREAVYALYYDQLRRAIEDKGTENFPELGGKKIYGELTMVVTVNFDGRTLDTEVVQASGNRVLDRYAQAIVRNAGPFGAFSPAMRVQADQIVVVSRFKFTHDDKLETVVAR